MYNKYGIVNPYVEKFSRLMYQLKTSPDTYSLLFAGATSKDLDLVQKAIDLLNSRSYEISLTLTIVGDGGYTVCLAREEQND